MKTLVAGLMSSAWVLFAQAESGAADVLNGWGNLTALGALIVALLFLVTKYLPDQQRKFIEQSQIFATAMKDAQAANLTIIDKIAERRHVDDAALATALRELSAQCSRRHSEISGA